MALADLADYKAKLGSPFQRLGLAKQSFSNGSYQLTVWSPMDTFRDAADGAFGGFPTQAALDKTSAIAMFQSQFVNGAANQWLGRCSIRRQWLSDSIGPRYDEGTLGAVMLIDRLSGSLTGAMVAGTDTTNLPTTALPRYTTGEGVHVALLLLNANGSPDCNVTLSYTNSAGTAGRTTGIVVVPNSQPAQRDFRTFGLQAGDTGVRSVQSITFSASTGVGVNGLGILLYKPLVIMPSLNGREYQFEPLESARFVEVQANACLGLIDVLFNNINEYTMSNGFLEFFEA